MFQGVIPILATPFHDDESLDLESWRRLLEFMVELGVDGVTILGVLGESNRLNDHERARARSRRAVSVVDGRMPIIVGHEPHRTRAAAYLSRMAQDLGADAVMVTPAKEAVPNDDRIVEMYQQIADGLTIPIVLQDHPASSEVHMSARADAARWSGGAGHRCVKEEAVPTAPKIRQLRDGLAERRVPILTGLGALYAPFDLEAGSDGFNTGFAFPEVLMAMVAAARAGDWAACARHLCAVRRAHRVRAATRRGVPQGDPAAPRPAGLRARAASGRDDHAAPVAGSSTPCWRGRCRASTSRGRSRSDGSRPQRALA